MITLYSLISAIIVMSIVWINERSTINIGSLKSRLNNSISIQSILRFARYNTFILFTAAIIYYQYQSTFLYEAVFSFVTSPIFIDFILQFLAFSLGIGLLVFSLRFRTITDNLRTGGETKRINFLPRYLTYSVVSAMIVATITACAVLLVIGIDYSLLESDFYPNYSVEEDALGSVTKTSSYHHGVYISIVITALVFIIVSAALTKRITLRRSRKWIYFFVFGISSLTIYSGVYAIANYIFNSMYLEDNIWLDRDKLLGHYSVRLTAIILGYSMLKFMYENVFGRSLSFVIKYSLTTSSPSRNQDYRINRDEKDLNNYFNRYYFAQVGFYSINVFVAEVLISMETITGSYRFFLVLLPIMIDDYLVIHHYFEKFNYMYKRHRNKKLFFNASLLIFSIVTLFMSELYLLPLFYILVSASLYSIVPKKN